MKTRTYTFVYLLRGEEFNDGGFQIVGDGFVGIRTEEGKDRWTAANTLRCALANKNRISVDDVEIIAGIATKKDIGLDFPEYY